MMNVKKRRCVVAECKKSAIFNFPCYKKGVWCKQHAPENAINICSSKKCNFESCLKNPSFNYPGCKKPLTCLAHREKGMVNVKNKKCEEKNCTRRALYKREGDIRNKWCKDHSSVNTNTNKNIIMGNNFHYNKIPRSHTRKYIF